jgi:hypothetical protein
VELDPTFDKTADLDNLTGNGIASRRCLNNPPPDNLLVGGRVFLASGSLEASHVSDREWIFDQEDTPSPSGTRVEFSQEIEYNFFRQPSTADVEIVARPMDGAGNPERLTLEAGSEIAISNLCPIERKGVVMKEIDFLAYYALLSVLPPLQKRVIPHRVKDTPTSVPHSPFDRIGMSACPPATTILET